MTRPEYPGTPLILWFYAVLFALVLGTSHYLGGPDDIESAANSEASLLDALQQAQAERPDLWTTEQRVRAQQAARIAAQHTVAKAR